MAMNAGSATMKGESLWPRLAGLPLVIEACEYERLNAVLAYEFERITTHVRLVGAGVDGLGEDISVFREDGTALHRPDRRCRSRENGHWPASMSTSRRSSCGRSRRSGTGRCAFASGRSSPPRSTSRCARPVT